MSTAIPEQGTPRVGEACRETSPRRKGQREQLGTSRRKRQRQYQLQSLPTTGPRGVTHVDVDVLVRLPKHSSALSHPCVRNRLLYYEPTEPFVPNNRTTSTTQPCDGSSESNNSDIDDDSSLQLSSALNLELRCHHPGVLWRGLLPMIFAPSEDNNGKARDGNGNVGGDRDGDGIHSSDNEKDARFTSKNVDSDQFLLSLRKLNRFTATMALSQRALLGLGLEDAVKRYRKTMVHHGGQIHNTTGDYSEEENPTYDDDTGKGLFYERRVRLPLGLLPRSSNNNNNTSSGDRNGVARSSSCSTNSSSKVFVVVWIFPPLRPPSDIDRTIFAGIVSKTQKKVLIQKGWSAWLSTLGGGYFGIKSLEKSLWLSRQQKNLAVWLGDTKMARQCTVNEAYNWMYSGRFKLAGSVLDNLEDEVARTRRAPSIQVLEAASGGNSSSSNNNNKSCSSYYTIDDQKILQLCSTARVCLRRLKLLSQKGLGKYHQFDNERSTASLTSRTHDDFQRVRIVSC
jgi:hypothetical protein